METPSVEDAWKSSRGAAPLGRCSLFTRRVANVRNGSLADIRERLRDVRFTLKSGHARRRIRCLLSAISGLLVEREIQLMDQVSGAAALHAQFFT